MLSTFTPRLDALPAAQKRFWPELKCVPRHFVLYGGTALALHMAHRMSIDFDFFSSEEFQPDDLARGISWLRSAERLQSSPNTLTVAVVREEPIRISFFGGLSIGRVGEPLLTNDKVAAVASLLDIAATKAAVLPQRAEQKDYLDMAQLLKAGIGLVEILGAARALHPETFNPMIALKALTYFQDGDLPELPAEVKRLLCDAAGKVADIPSVKRVSNQISAPAA